MKTIAVIVGTRPEAVKLAPIVVKLRERTDLEVAVIATGQHKALCEDVLGTFSIEATTWLDVMKTGQSLGELTARLLTALDLELLKGRPHMVLVQGDTTSAFAGALAAFYHKIPVAHVEAGLRTGNLGAPWPEQANRCLISRLATLHFAPTEGARANLLREGVEPGRIYVTGNSGIDALLMTREWLPTSDIYCDQPTPFVLITAHRREHFGAALDEICEAIADLAGLFSKMWFVFPVHPNPQVQDSVRRVLKNPDDPRLKAGNVALVQPANYASFVAMLERCTLILTDSGGIQEEAPSLGKPVLVMRDETERPEAIEAGTALLVGTSRKRIVEETTRLLNDAAARRSMTARANPFGDGRASERIVAACVDFLERSECR